MILAVFALVAALILFVLAILGKLGPVSIRILSEEWTLARQFSSIERILAGLLAVACMVLALYGYQTSRDSTAANVTPLPVSTADTPAGTPQQAAATVAPTEPATVLPTGTRTVTAAPAEALTPVPTPTPDLAYVVDLYRVSVEAILYTFDLGALAQLPNVATGEAYASLRAQAATLQHQDQYRRHVIKSTAQIQSMLGDRTAGIYAREQHIVRTYQREQGADTLIVEDAFDATVVYGLVFDNGRWKVDQVVTVP